MKNLNISVYLIAICHITKIGVWKVQNNYFLIREIRMKKEEKKEYQKPELVEHENLNEVTKAAAPSFIE